MKKFNEKFLSKSPFKTSYLVSPSTSDSVDRGNINSNIKVLGGPSGIDMPTDNQTQEVKKYVPGVDGPEFYGGGLPVSRFGQVMDVLKFGWKNLIPGG